jgi:hypothetical protein
MVAFGNGPLTAALDGTVSMVTVQTGMALAVFTMGVVACVGGIGTILAREYQQTLRNLSSQSNRLHAKALQELGVVPILDSSARLVEAVNKLVRTAMGVGAFLCMIGVSLCLIGFWMYTA